MLFQNVKPPGVWNLNCQKTNKTKHVSLIKQLQNLLCFSLYIISIQSRLHPTPRSRPSWIVSPPSRFSSLHRICIKNQKYIKHSYIHIIYFTSVVVFCFFCMFNSCQRLFLISIRYTDRSNRVFFFLKFCVSVCVDRCWWKHLLWNQQALTNQEKGSDTCQTGSTSRIHKFLQLLNFSFLL